MSKARTLAGTVSDGAVLADGTVDAAEIGNLTLPTGGDIVGTTATQTLTNKTINIANNTLTGVQPTLVSGTNIKTINGGSVLGSGDLAVGGGSLVHLSTVTASFVATVDIETTFNSTYDNYVIVANNVEVFGTSVTLHVYPKLNGTYTPVSGWAANGSTAIFSSTASYIQTASSGTSTRGDIISSLTSSGANGLKLEFVMEIMGPVSSDVLAKGLIYRGVHRNGTNAAFSFVGGLMYLTSGNNCGPLTGIRFQASSGNISGTFRLYGIKNS